jgi:hypothetical protein
MTTDPTAPIVEAATRLIERPDLRAWWVAADLAPADARGARSRITRDYGSAIAATAGEL